MCAYACACERELFISQLCVSYIAERARNYCYSSKMLIEQTRVWRKWRAWFIPGLYLTLFGPPERERPISSSPRKSTARLFSVRKKESRIFDIATYYCATRSTGHAKYIPHIIAVALVHIRDSEVGRYLTQICVLALSRCHPVHLLFSTIYRAWRRKCRTNFRPLCFQRNLPPPSRSLDKSSISNTSLIVPLRILFLILSAAQTVFLDRVFPFDVNSLIKVKIHQG